MKSSKKLTGKARLFGAAYEQDERIRSAADKAGHYSFCAFMFILFVCMTAGLFIEWPALYIPYSLAFLCGSLIYLFFMVKNGAFSTAPTNQKTYKVYLAYLVGVAVYAPIKFSFTLLAYEGEGDPDLQQMALQSLAQALIWVVLFFLLIKLLTAWSNRRIEKHIDSD